MQDIKQIQETAAMPVAFGPNANMSTTFELSESFENLALDASHHASRKQDSHRQKTIANEGVLPMTSNREFTGRDRTNKMNSQQSDSQQKAPLINNLTNENTTKVIISSTVNTKEQQQSALLQLTKTLTNETAATETQNPNDLHQNAQLTAEAGDSSQISSNSQKASATTSFQSDAVSSKQVAIKGQTTVGDQWKERMVAYRKNLNKSLVSLTDQLDTRDIQCVAEMTNCIYANMRRDEVDSQLPSDFLSRIQLHNEVKDTSRAFLVEWIIDVHRKFRLLPETLYVTVQLIDKYLSMKQIKKTQLHILGVTSLLIATKYEEIYPPELKDLLSVSENKFTRGEVLNMELDMLMVLQFQITRPTAYRFLERFNKLLPSLSSDDQLFFYAQYIQEIALLDAGLLKYRPSEIAAVSLILAFKGLKKSGHAWNKEMETVTGMQESELQQVKEDVRSFVVEVNPKFLTTLKYKFNKESFKQVACLPLDF